MYQRQLRVFTHFTSAEQYFQVDLLLRLPVALNNTRALRQTVLCVHISNLFNARRKSSVNQRIKNLCRFRDPRE